jgi:hypothetical protein
LVYITLTCFRRRRLGCKSGRQRLSNQRSGLASPPKMQGFINAREKRRAKRWMHANWQVHHGLEFSFQQFNPRPMEPVTRACVRGVDGGVGGCEARVLVPHLGPMLQAAGSVEITTGACLQCCRLQGRAAQALAVQGRLLAASGCAEAANLPCFQCPYCRLKA